MSWHHLGLLTLLCLPMLEHQKMYPLCAQGALSLPKQAQLRGSYAAIALWAAPTRCCACPPWSTCGSAAMHSMHHAQMALGFQHHVAAGAFSAPEQAQLRGSYAAVATVGGSLTLLRLPTMEHVWQCSHAADAPQVLIPDTAAPGVLLLYHSPAVSADSTQQRSMLLLLRTLVIALTGMTQGCQGLGDWDSTARQLPFIIRHICVQSVPSEG